MGFATIIALNYFVNAIVSGLLIMWADLEEEIGQKAKLLKDNGYEYTGKWCESFLTNLNRYPRNPQMLAADFDDLLLTFRQEYIGRTDFGSLSLREKYLSIVQTLLENAIRNSPNPKEMFHELLPFLEQGLNTSKTVSEVVRIFRDFDDRFLEVRVYASLFVFMLHVEGEYFPTIRTLYGLSLGAKGKSIDFRTINKMDFKNLKKEMGRFCKPLFVAYDDLGRNLRNAIAHAHFRFEKGKLICWNIEPTARKETWKREFTYSELTAALVDIYSIAHAYLFWYMLRELTGKIIDYAKLREVDHKTKAHLHRRRS